jgi:chromosome segregation ATPase
MVTKDSALEQARKMITNNADQAEQDRRRLEEYRRTAEDAEQKIVAAEKTRLESIKNISAVAKQKHDLEIRLSELESQLEQASRKTAVSDMTHRH